MQLLPHIILMLESFSNFMDETCDSDCDKLSPVGYWKVEKIKCDGTKEGCFPSLEQLQRLCPQTLQFLDCKSRTLDDCEELRASPDLNLSFLTKYSIGIENIVRDVCNVNSSFHADYILKVNCYKGMYFTVTEACWKMYNQTKREFIEYLDLTDKDIPDEVKCLLIGYQDACLAQRVQEFCGRAGQRIFVDSQRVLKDISSIDCSQIDEEWESKFFDFLQKMWKVSFKESFWIV